MSYTNLQHHPQYTQYPLSQSSPAPLSYASTPSRNPPPHCLPSGIDASPPNCNKYLHPSFRQSTDTVIELQQQIIALTEENAALKEKVASLESDAVNTPRGVQKVKVELEGDGSSTLDGSTGVPSWRHVHRIYVEAQLLRSSRPAAPVKDERNCENWDEPAKATNLPSFFTDTNGSVLTIGCSKWKKYHGQRKTISYDLLDPRLTFKNLDEDFVELAILKLEDYCEQIRACDHHWKAREMLRQHHDEYHRQWMKGKKPPLYKQSFDGPSIEHVKEEGGYMSEFRKESSAPPLHSVSALPIPPLHHRNAVSSSHHITTSVASSSRSLSPAFSPVVQESHPVNDGGEESRPEEPATAESSELSTAESSSEEEEEEEPAIITLPEATSSVIHSLDPLPSAKKLPGQTRGSRAANKMGKKERKGGGKETEPVAAVDEVDGQPDRKSKRARISGPPTANETIKARKKNAANGVLEHNRAEGKRTIKPKNRPNNLPPSTAVQQAPSNGTEKTLSKYSEAQILEIVNQYEVERQDLEQ